jgi:hypothetical protein
MGIEIAGNRNLWPQGEGWLIPEAQEPPEAFDVVLISHESYRGRGTLPSAYTGLRGPTRVYVDESDGWRTDASSDPDWPADLVLRAHFNGKYRYPGKVKPWAFGLTNRMIDATVHQVPARERPTTILCNFRVGHPVRDRLTAAFKAQAADQWTWDEHIDMAIPEDPQARRYWELTGRRHNPAYYRRLGHAQGCLAFGGFFAPGWASAPRSVAGRLAYRVVQATSRPTRTLTQFDSWRFWESVASGTITVHAPLQAWGAVLPVMPEDGTHYCSFTPGEGAHAFRERWNSCLDSAAGRSWALAYYSPEAQARRLLEWLSL